MSEDSPALALPVSAVSCDEHHQLNRNTQLPESLKREQWPMCENRCVLWDHAPFGLDVHPTLHRGTLGGTPREGGIHVFIFLMHSGACACLVSGQAATCAWFVFLILTKHPVYPS